MNENCPIGTWTVKRRKRQACNYWSHWSTFLFFESDSFVWNVCSSFIAYRIPSFFKVALTFDVYCRRHPIAFEYLKSNNSHRIDLEANRKWPWIYYVYYRNWIFRRMLLLWNEKNIKFNCWQFFVFPFNFATDWMGNIFDEFFFSSSNQCCRPKMTISKMWCHFVFIFRFPHTNPNRNSTNKIFFLEMQYRRRWRRQWHRQKSWASKLNDHRILSFCLINV